MLILFQDGDVSLLVKSFGDFESGLRGIFFSKENALLNSAYFHQ
jgi:hypothetical protein